MTRARAAKGWLPALHEHSGPRYRAIADAMEADIQSGRLTPGQSLPTQRELADRLGVNFTTVTRAYTEARRRGLITATVGRGTFVASPHARQLAQGEGAPRDLDLSVNAPALPRWLSATFRTTLETLAGDERVARNVLSYDSRVGDAAAREAGAEWLRGQKLDAPTDRIVPTGGAQHALTLLLLSFTKPGDTVLVESLAYPGLLSAADVARVHVVGVPLDDDGADPDALAALAERHRASLFFCVPTLQNPTTAVMPLARRREIVAVARKQQLRIIEDDICGPLVPEATPLVALEPEHVIYIASLSKCVAPGLRAAFVLMPDLASAAQMNAAVRSSLLMLSPLPFALAAAWISDGTAARVVNDVRREARARTAIARKYFGDRAISAPTGSLHAWLRLPKSWTVAAFVGQAQQLGIRVAPADWYAAPSSQATPAPAAVRITLGAEADRDRVARALQSLAGLIAQPPSMRSSSL
ncbi:MAG TPA: PLP-dependent aminotransferase family protein [Gemmatimonadaceae bacterium]|nr:PLP-dependent aminotransferase family protein [Gemmatimonadaceae bacterium]